MTSDTDCNQVAFFPLSPDHSTRCTAPEGHEGMCWLTSGECWLTSGELMRHKHRKPIPTFTDPFGVVPVGGRHRRPVVAAPACAEVRRRLAVAVEAAAVSL